ncbi:MAG: D-glycerate dehydrogenase [Acidimicrobiales bacterium]
MKVFVSRTLPGDTIDALRATPGLDVDVWENITPPPRDEVVRRVAGCDGLLSMLTERVDDAVFDAAPDLRVVSNMAVGVDNIDVAAATARGIPVGHTPGILTDATADIAFALILASRRRLVEGVDLVRSGGWVPWYPEFMVSQPVAGQTLGLIGYGRIAQAVARRARGFDMEILVHTRTPPDDPDVTAVSLEDLLRRADIVSLHCPLTPETRHLIDADALAAMKTTATLVNTARGPVVDETALVAALQDGTIAGAGLDVTEIEPLPADSPLPSLTNCVVIPHLGSATIPTRTLMAERAVTNLLAGLAGEPLPHTVNPGVGNSD